MIPPSQKLVRRSFRANISKHSSGLQNVYGALPFFPGFLESWATSAKWEPILCQQHPPSISKIRLTRQRLGFLLRPGLYYRAGSAKTWVSQLLSGTVQANTYLTNGRKAL